MAKMVDVPRNLSKVKIKLAFGMTKRQLICFAIVGVIGLIFYWMTYRAIGTTMALAGMILILLPVLFIANYEKDGRFVEDIVKDVIDVKIKNPALRLYESQNSYEWMQEKIYEREVLEIEPIQVSKGRQLRVHPVVRTEKENCKGKTERSKEAGKVRSGQHTV